MYIIRLITSTGQSKTLTFQIRCKTTRTLRTIISTANQIKYFFFEKIIVWEHFFREGTGNSISWHTKELFSKYTRWGYCGKLFKAKTRTITESLKHWSKHNARERSTSISTRKWDMFCRSCACPYTSVHLCYSVLIPQVGTRLKEKASKWFLDLLIRNPLNPFLINGFLKYIARASTDL